MKQNRPQRKIVVKRKERARPVDLAQRYEEVRALRRKLEAFAAVTSSTPRRRKIDA
jgi:hypothetical protein